MSPGLVPPVLLLNSFCSITLPRTVSSKVAIASILFLLGGAPIVLYVWRVLDEVLSGNVHRGAVLGGLAAIAVFIGLAAVLGHVLRNEQRS
jgi:hypothetical protein